ncbi:MAG TPA: alpha/beta fold hydrolase [Bryobacteraceae bacterium]|nr:alpha/beta fold hydrolase [Bryobacteraceae bacterium]
MDLTRRELLAFAPLAYQANGGATPAGDVLWDYFVRRLSAADEQRRRKLASLGTVAELTALRTRVRGNLLADIGGFPERTPLNAKQTGVLERSDYVIEKILFESRPRFYVTASIYRPKSAGMRRPAVIQSCGHYVEGKAAADYQRTSIGLARKGFVVLTFDPLGQSERRMYQEVWDKNPDASATSEHAIAGRPCFLLGRTLAHYRIWDAIRALDYLETRPDVDKAHLGMVGHSGGGMMTLLTAALEDRLQAVMSCCAVTSFYHKFRAFLPGDPEQVIPRIYEQGIDHPELIASVAPRAFLIGAAQRDFVPLDGARRTYEEAKQAFAIAGVPDRLGKTETNDEHKMNQELREACCAWMLKHLAGESGDTRERDCQIETPADLWCTPNGRSMEIAGARSIFDLNRDYSRQLQSSRKGVQRQDVLRLLALPAMRVESRRLNDGPTGFRIESESGVELPATLSGPKHTEILLILAAEQGRNSPAARNLSRHLMEAGYPVLGVDLRGWGETAPKAASQFVKAPGEEFFAVHGIELGRPILGMRVHDLLAAVRLMQGQYKKIYAIGLEAGGLVVLHAAAVDNSISGVATYLTLNSYQDVLERPVSHEPLASFVPSALAYYDLAELSRIIAPRPAVAIQPRDSMRRPYTSALPEETVARKILSGLHLRR